MPGLVVRDVSVIAGGLQPLLSRGSSYGSTWNAPYFYKAGTLVELC